MGPPTVVQPDDARTAKRGLPATDGQGKALKERAPGLLSRGRARRKKVRDGEIPGC